MASQTLLLLVGLSYAVYIACQWIKSIESQWDSYLLFKWSQNYDSLRDLKKLLSLATCLNVISLIAILAGLFTVKKWIKDTFEGERRWRCSTDGNFLVYFIFLLTHTLLQVVLTVYSYQVDSITWYWKIIHWGNG